MRRILISGYYGFGNTGDEAILQSMVSEFRRTNPETLISVLSKDPCNTAKTHNVKSVNRNDLSKIIQEIKQCDAVVSGGGSLFQDTTSFYSPWYYSAILIIAFIFGKPVFAYAQGMGPIYHTFNRMLLKFVMKRVKYISVRDNRSKLELEKWGIKNEINCTVDPAFLITPIDKERSLKILEDENGSPLSNRPKVSFSIRKWKEDVDIVDVVSTAADMVYEKLGADIVFISLYNKDDLSLAKEISEKMKNPSLVVKGTYNPSELSGLYGMMEINVCVRFHALVFSAMNNVPMTAISYDPKVDSFMEYLGINTIVKYREMNPQNVFNAIRKKWEMREQLKEYITNKSAEFKEIAKQGITEIDMRIEEIKGC